MGNYSHLEIDFIERTISLIQQYNELIEGKPFGEQLNYTLTINCFLGLIVMPKERALDFIPDLELNEVNLHEMGLVNTVIDESINTLKELIHNLRHSIAHFDIEIISECERQLVDYIKFNGTRNQPPVIAKFHAPEVFPFLQYYAHGLTYNLRANHR